MHDDQVSRFWGHPEIDCYDVVARHFSIIRADGHECSTYQHAMADLHDPSWVGSREAVVQRPAMQWSSESIAPEIKTLGWPPSEGLSVWMLCQMTTLCAADANRILSAPRKEPPPGPAAPRADKRGQFSLF